LPKGGRLERNPGIVGTVIRARFVRSPGVDAPKCTDSRPERSCQARFVLVPEQLTSEEFGEVLFFTTEGLGTLEEELLFLVFAVLVSMKAELPP